MSAMRLQIYLCLFCVIPPQVGINWRVRYMSKKYLKKKKGGAWKWVLLVFLVLLIAAGTGFYFLVIDNIVEEITVEAGSQPLPESFMDRKWDIPISFETPLGENELLHPGDYPVTLNYCRLSYSGTVHVRDTVKPEADTKDVTVLAIHPPQPEDFLVEVRDVTQVSIGFGTTPDLTKAGDQTVTVLLTDEGGNTAEVPANLTVIIDTQPPVIEGVQKEFLIYQGDTVSYRAGITVTDDIDENPEFTIDNSQVDLSTPGEYTVAYIATDEFGNIATEESKVTVLEKKANYVDLETIHTAVTQQLQSIVSDGMTTEEQVRAIYRWIRGHCGYINHSDKDDYRQTGYIMLTKHAGDCFGYFSLSKLMFEALGIPNIDVVKVKNYPGDSSHYWSLVSVDGGETYYHFDTTPRVSGGDFCLVSDAFMDNYSANYRNCFNRDKSLYPATPEDSL